LENSVPLSSLGWSDFFKHQLDDTELALTPVRVAGVHRGRLDGLSVSGPIALPFAGGMSSGDFAIGDWVLSDGIRILRPLERQTLLTRRAAGTGQERQLIAANVDTLFIVTSCNADFNPARLERYLALAAEAGCTAVILLTKADTSAKAEDYRAQAARLQRGLSVLTLDARSSDVAADLSPWCTAGQTVALVGSSGVGKTTLTNTLTGQTGTTGPIRESDARGRHTTTQRSMHALASGAWLIDTPGMRSLGMADVTEGIDAVFAEVTDLLGQCRFRDCTHQHEPGCAIRLALAEGRLDEARLARWEKLKREDRQSRETPAEARERARRFGKKVQSALSSKPRTPGKG
jgi:ribosome biogenesis GTPase / thiamine phosphate phosphatase